MKPIYIVTGQTATGKTKYAIELATKLNGEIINCDSRQIYKKLDIITGKDLSNKEYHLITKLDNFEIGYYLLQSQKIWLYDIVDPHENFSFVDYRRCAQHVIDLLLSQNKTPIIVGGSYLYIKHLFSQLDHVAIMPDWNLRKELELKTVHELQLLLNNYSTDTFNKLNTSDRSNPRRLIRKIEIELSPKKDVTREEKPSDYTLHYIGFRYSSKERLQSVIKTRVEERITAGAIQEVKKLLSKGYTEKDPGLNAIGYKQIIQYIRNEITLEETRTNWITQEIQYAKRQLTFMKSDINIKWQTL